MKYSKLLLYGCAIRLWCGLRNENSYKRRVKTSIQQYGFGFSLQKEALPTGSVFGPRQKQAISGKPFQAEGQDATLIYEIKVLFIRPFRRMLVFDMKRRYGFSWVSWVVWEHGGRAVAGHKRRQLLK